MEEEEVTVENLDEQLAKVQEKSVKKITTRKKRIHINKTVTKNFIMDFVASLQNMFGMNLKTYEKMLDKGMKQIDEALGERKLAWYRYEITELRSGALSITLYGEEDEVY